MSGRQKIEEARALLVTQKQMETRYALNIKAMDEMKAAAAARMAAVKAEFDAYRTQVKSDFETHSSKMLNHRLQLQ